MSVVHYWDVWAGFVTNPDTGRLGWLDEDSVWGFNGSAMTRWNDKFYIIESGQDLNFSIGRSYTAIREWDGTSDNTKLLYWYQSNLSTSKLDFVSWGSDGRQTSMQSNGEGGTGFYPQYQANIRVRDGWLYWLDQASSRGSQGHTFARINLAELIANYETNGPTQHNPTEPLFEILNNASAPWEGNGKWQPMWNTGYNILHREGSSPIHNTIENNWFFDDSGAIVFMHEEFPNWRVNSERTCWMMSRLVPDNLLNVSIVFEGQALKGYSNVRQQQTAWAPEEVVLQ
jgi:hypothetical protein